MERRILITAAGAFFAVLVAGALFQPGMIGLGRADSTDGATSGSPSAISSDAGAAAPSGSYDDGEGYGDDDDRYEHEDDDDHDRYEHEEHEDHEDDDD